MDVIITKEELLDLYKKNGIEHHDIQNVNVRWNKTNIKEMIKSQVQLNDIILNTKQFQKGEYLYVKKILTILNEDIKKYYESVCSICGDKQSYLFDRTVEHIKIEKDWGFGSIYDMYHQLILCEHCYDKSIMKPLSDYIKCKDTN